MKRIISVLSYSTLSLNGLLIILAIFSSKISPGNWLQVGGRLHPLLLHLPIGFYALFVLLIIGWPDSKSFRKTSKVLIHLTAFLIVLTAIAGVLLSREGGYDEAILKRHLVLGTIMSVVTLLLSQFSEYIQHRYYKIYASLGMAILFVTGHFGAVLTHGENYIFEPVSPKQELPKDSTVFSMAIQPVLNAKCGSCHNPSKKKGELILTLHDGILKGGEHGAVFKAGNPDKSELILRAQLPIDNDDHMPPAGKAQLTETEITLLQSWIAAGATFDRRFNPANTADTLQHLSNTIVLAYAEQSSERQYPFAFVDDATIAQLNTPFRTVKQISTTEPAVKADFFLAQYFQSESLEELKQVAENVIDLNLAGMPVGDEIINALLKLYNLERLNLNNTQVTDKSMEQLAKLEKLTAIKLAGTAITGKGMESLAKSKSIKEVYGWNTKTSDTEWADLKKRFNGIVWNTGFKPGDNEILKLTPPMLKNETFLLSKDEPIVLKHNLPGTLIRYTLNDTSPDSTSSTSYEKPIVLTSHSVLKAIAVKDGWRKSNEVQFQFFVKGIAPESTKLLTTPSKDYKASGSATFANNALGDPDNFRDGNWIGFREGTMSVIFNFSKEQPKEITIVYLQSIGSFIMPPESVEVLGGEKENSVRPMKQIKPDQPKKYLPNSLGSVTVSLENPSKWLKLNIKPVAKLPPWHSGKGEKAWVMVSEVIFR